MPEVLVVSSVVDELEKREYNLHCFIIRVLTRVFAVVTNLKKAYCTLAYFCTNVLGLI